MSNQVSIPIDLEDFEEQIQQLLSSVESSLTSELNKIRGTERIEVRPTQPTYILINKRHISIAQKCHYLKNRLQRARQVYRSIQVEIREIQNSEVQAEWETKAKAFDQHISKLTQDVDWAEKSTTMDKKAPASEMKSSDLLIFSRRDFGTDWLCANSRQWHDKPGNHKNGASNSRYDTRVDREIKATHSGDNRGFFSVWNWDAPISHKSWTQIGTAANGELKNQGEKLLQIEENVEQVETNLKRADRQLRIFIRWGTVNDHYFWHMV